MSTKIPHRSTGGCLTCKRRKKKCDETRPECIRCRNGNFDCLGYGHLEGLGVSTLGQGIGNLTYEALDAVPFNIQQNSSSPRNLGALTQGDSSLVLDRECAEAQIWGNQPSEIQIRGWPSATIPRSIQINPLELDNMVQFITTQHVRISQQVIFRPSPLPLENSMAQYVKSSPYIRWSMYIGARIAQALLEGTSWHPYVGWINDFHLRITNIPFKTETGINELAARLDSLHSLSGSAFMVLGSSIGYALYRHCAPLFLQLTARFPEVWTNDSAISISHALSNHRYEIPQFITADTIMSLAFAIPPLIQYDTTLRPEVWSRNHYPSFLDWLYGWPPIMIILFAMINSSRISRQLGQLPLSEGEQMEIEARLREWTPIIDHGDRPTALIAKLAVQECWRHSVLIYMFMGACGADSADPRVEASVLQIAQLVSALEDGNSLEVHLLIPCLIAGVAARKEKHRKVFHKKITAFHGVNALLLRGADLIHVLDHLWHGAASEGRAVTWDDYANSRSVILPIEI